VRSGGCVARAAGVAPDGDAVLGGTEPGVGIPRDAVGHIFGMCQQLPGTGGGGVGLGLHIVRRFVEVLGGTVSVTSEVGRGSCFTVTLPVTATAPAADHPRASTTAHAA